MRRADLDSVPAEAGDVYLPAAKGFLPYGGGILVLSSRVRSGVGAFLECAPACSAFVSCACANVHIWFDAYHTPHFDVPPLALCLPQMRLSDSNISECSVNTHHRELTSDELELCGKLRPKIVEMQAATPMFDIQTENVVRNTFLANKLVATYCGYGEEVMVNCKIDQPHLCTRSGDRRLQSAKGGGSQGGESQAPTSGGGKPTEVLAVQEHRITLIVNGTLSSIQIEGAAEGGGLFIDLGSFLLLTRVEISRCLLNGSSDLLLADTRRTGGAGLWLGDTQVSMRRVTLLNNHVELKLASSVSPPDQVTELLGSPTTRLLAELIGIEHDCAREANFHTDSATNVNVLNFRDPVAVPFRGLSLTLSNCRNPFGATTFPRCSDGAVSFAVPHVANVPLCNSGATCTNALVWVSSEGTHVTTPTCACTGTSIPSPLVEDSLLAPYSEEQASGCKLPVTLEALQHVSDVLQVQLGKTISGPDIQEKTVTVSVRCTDWSSSLVALADLSETASWITAPVPSARIQQIGPDAGIAQLTLRINSAGIMERWNAYESQIRVFVGPEEAWKSGDPSWWMAHSESILRHSMIVVRMLLSAAPVAQSCTVNSVSASKVELHGSFSFRVTARDVEGIQLTHDGADFRTQVGH